MPKPETGIKQTQLTWKGEKNRPLELYRPCSCGCDQRGGYKGVGYLSGSDERGNGFTIWIQDEEVFRTFRRLLSRRLIAAVQAGMDASDA